MNLTAVFIGAHPDDLEIAAGGTIAKLIKLGYSVWLIVLSDEQDEAIAKLRREEAYKATLEMRNTSGQLIFLGGIDGKVVGDKDSVAALRKVLTDHSIKPDLVFTHSMSDDHQDHRACHEIVKSAIRDAPRLYFPVVNHVVVSSFTPSVFIDVTDTWNTKIKALSCHESQSDRIDIEQIGSLCGGFVSQCSSAFVEAFEFDLPIKAEGKRGLVNEINDSAFHKLWMPIIGDRNLSIIYGVTVNRTRRDHNWRPDMDREGSDLFRREYERKWLSSSECGPLEVHRCDDPNITQIIANSDVLLSGGPVSNTVTRNLFNHLQGIRYVIDYTMPDYKNICIIDREENKSIVASYSANTHGNTTLKVDRGILTVMQNPLTNSNQKLIALMGIHGYGTLGCFKCVAETDCIGMLLNVTDKHLKQCTDFQVLIDFDVESGIPKVIEDSVHTFNSSGRMP